MKESPWKLLGDQGVLWQDAGIKSVSSWVGCGLVFKALECGSKGPRFHSHLQRVSSSKNGGEGFSLHLLEGTLSCRGPQAPGIYYS